MTYPSPTHLILVCCHAIYTSGPTHGASPSEWLLAPFQTNEVPTFTSHIQTGLTILTTDPLSLLVFSGSKTRPETQLSEAQSYLNLCNDSNFWGILKTSEDDGSEKRIMLEEQALDSFGNLIFGLLKFWKKTRTWPEKVSIVSHDFKKRRFLELHVKALRFPREKVVFVGIDPTYMVEGNEDYDEKRRDEVVKGEMERGFGEWRRDLMGVGMVLRGKRVGRNVWGVSQVWFESEEDRSGSGVRCKIVEYEYTDARRGLVKVTEEILTDERQPWEMESIR